MRLSSNTISKDDRDYLALLSSEDFEKKMQVEKYLTARLKNDKTQAEINQMGIIRIESLPPNFRDQKSYFFAAFLGTFTAITLLTIVVLACGHFAK